MLNRKETMKQFIHISVLAIVCATAVEADEAIGSKSTPTDISEDYAGKFGAGIIIGEPTGVSLKYWLNDTLAVDGAAGWSFHDNSEFYLHGDLLAHNFDLIPVSKGKLPVYLGGGVFARFRDEHHDNQIGVRVPVGISYMFADLPVDVFAEVAPGIDLAPSTRFDLMGGVGIRYWF